MNKKENIVIVNATALRVGGGLAILNQFINAIPEDNYSYYIFVDKESFENGKINKRNDHLLFIPLEKRSFIKRFLWDAVGLKKYLKTHNIIPEIAVSLQNTGFRLNKCVPNFIYYHQSIPLYPNRWSPFKSSERRFWFYKRIYPFFTKLFINKKTNIFVQLEFIKAAFAKKYNFSTDKIHVIFPDIDIPKPESIENLIIDNKKINLFYPAAPLKYKNHSLLIESLSKIDNELTENIVLYLTCNSSNFQYVYNFKNIEVKFLGELSHSNIIWLYSKMDALVFPSLIESLGLPLIEATHFGLPIITVNLPYAKEVLKGYSEAAYVNAENPAEWGKEILKITHNPAKNYNPLTMQNKNSWEDFFKIIKQDK